MRIVYCLIFFVFVYTCSCGQTKQGINCEYFKFNNKDSVCLDVITNLDTGKVVQLLLNEKKDVLLIFDGITNRSIELLRSKNLSNSSVRAALEKLKIIRLYIDDRAKINPGDRITIGEMNMRFQMNRFHSAAQPHYVILKKGKPACNSAYLPDDKAILSFFKTCEIK